MDCFQDNIRKFWLVFVMHCTNLGDLQVKFDIQGNMIHLTILSGSHKLAQSVLLPNTEHKREDTVEAVHRT